MADDTTADIIHLVQPGARRPPLTDAQRAKRYRERKKASSSKPKHRFNHKTSL
jgi:hypothetical protein